MEGVGYSTAAESPCFRPAPCAHADYLSLRPPRQAGFASCQGPVDCPHFDLATVCHQRGTSQTKEGDTFDLQHVRGSESLVRCPPYYAFSVLSGEQEGLLESQLY